MTDADTLEYPSPHQQRRGLGTGLRLKLSTMMFLQYALWGAWWVVLSIYLGRIGFTDPQIGAVYGTMAVASIFSPLIFGQIADRWVPTQYLLAGMQLIGAVMLYLLTQITTFGPFYACVLIYAMIYIPTISLTNSLSFHHIPDAARHFPGIRVFGTIGWIAAGLFVGWALKDTTSQPMYAAGILSVVLGVFCLMLPHTPPSGKAGDALPFVKALRLLRDGKFAFFLFVSFIISIVLAGYFIFAGPFLKSINIERIAPVASIMTLGQFTEMLLLPFLPFFLKHLGMKRTLALGMAAWGIRYGFFGLQEPVALVIVGIALHGICYDFFFVAAYIHVDNTASADIRASAQAMFNIVTMGVGMLLGTTLFGELVAHFRDGETVAWASVWSYPMIGVVVALVLFMLTFSDKKEPAAASA